MRLFSGSHCLQVVVVSSVVFQSSLDKLLVPPECLSVNKLESIEIFRRLKKLGG